MKITVPELFVWRSDRALKAVTESDDGALRFPAVLTTEKPGLRWFRDPDTGDYSEFDEICLCTESAVDLSRARDGIALKMFYGHNSMDLPIGTWTDVSVSRSLAPFPGLRGNGVFSRTDGDVYAAGWLTPGEKQPVSALRESVKTRSLDSVSIGYRTQVAKIVRKGAKWKSYEATERDLWIWTDWQLFEASLVPIPFDEYSQIGRTLAAESFTPEKLARFCRRGEESREIPCEIIAPSRMVRIGVDTQAAPAAQTGKENAMTIEELLERIAELDDSVRRELVSRVAQDAIKEAAAAAVVEAQETLRKEHSVALAAAKKEAREAGRQEERDYVAELETIAKDVAEDPDNVHADPLGKRILDLYGKPIDAVKAVAEVLREQRLAPLGGKKPAETESGAKRKFLG